MADEAGNNTTQAQPGDGSVDNDPEYKVPLRRSLDLFGAMAMCVGSMVGSGIFISPKGVLLYTGSVGAVVNIISFNSTFYSHRSYLCPYQYLYDSCCINLN